MNELIDLLQQIEKYTIVLGKQYKSGQVEIILKMLDTIHQVQWILFNEIYSRTKNTS